MYWDSFFNEGISLFGNISLWEPILSPLLSRLFPFFKSLIGSICSCISNDDDLINFLDWVDSLEAYFNSLISPTATDFNRLYKINEDVRLILKIACLNNLTKARIVVSKHYYFKLKCSISAFGVENIIQPWERLL
jgi:hypothetical protein